MSDIKTAFREWSGFNWNDNAKDKDLLIQASFSAGYQKAHSPWMPIELQDGSYNMPTDELFCWVILKTYPKFPKLLWWNPLHMCWDDEDADDYYCELDGVTHYMECKIPQPPKD